MKGRDSGLDSGPMGLIAQPGDYRGIDYWPEPSKMTLLNPETVCYKKCPLYENRKTQCEAYKLFSSFFREEKGLIEKIEKLRKEHCYPKLGLVVE